MHIKHLCSTCSTGARTLALDRDSVMCPYLECIKEGKCPFYVPVKDTTAAINDKNTG